MTSSISSSSDLAGKVVIYSVSGMPSAGIPYASFDAIAEFCGSNPDNPQDDTYGYPRGFMPQMAEPVAHAQNAWATGTGDFPTKGMLFNPGRDVKDFYFAKYDVEPIFRVRVVRHKKAAGSDVVKRHLYLDVYMATGEADTDGIPDDLNQINKDSKVAAAQAAAKQLTSLPVVVMEFAILETGKGDEKTRTPVMRFVPTEHVDQAIMPAVERLIGQMKTKVELAKNNAGDQAIRAGVRRWLQANSCFAVRGSGGNYFLPQRERTLDESGQVTEYSTDEKIDGLLCYFTELADLCTGQSSDRPEIMILDAFRSNKGSLHSQRTTESLMEKAFKAIDGRLESVLEDVAPVLQGALGEKASQKRIRTADLEVLQIMRDLDAYREAFQDQFEQLDGRIELADDRLEEARKSTS